MHILKWFGIALATLILAFSVWYLLQPSMQDVGITYAVPAPAKPEGVTAEWFGVTTLLIDDGDTQLMIDGYFSRPSLLDVALKRDLAPEQDTITKIIKQEKINRLAVVIPVHSHFDHALDSAEVAIQTGAQLLGSESTANIGRSSKLDESQNKVVEVGKPNQFGKFTVTLFPSEHAPLATNSGIDGIVSEPFELPAPYTAWQLGKAYSILIEHPQGNLLVQGSAGFVPDALGSTKVDAVFLGVGGLRDLPTEHTQQYINEMVTKTEPSNVYVVHHDNMFDKLGKVEQSKLFLAFDRDFASELTELVKPANLLQPRYAEPILIRP